MDKEMNELKDEYLKMICREYKQNIETDNLLGALNVIMHTADYWAKNDREFKLVLNYLDIKTSEVEESQNYDIRRYHQLSVIIQGLFMNHYYDEKVNRIPNIKLEKIMESIGTIFKEIDEEIHKYPKINAEINSK